MRLVSTRGRDPNLIAIRFLEDQALLHPNASRALNRREEETILGFGPDGASS